MNAGQYAFVEDMGQLMAGWGLPRNTGRIWAYLLMCSGPASLDEIAGELEIAKSGVSVGTRQLVQLGLARGIGERGSRRLRYEPLYELEAIFAARNAALLALLRALRAGAEASTGDSPRIRLADMAETIQQYVDEVPAVIARLRELRAARQRRRA